MFSKEWNDENNDKTLSKEHTSSAKTKIESYPEHETSSQQGKFIYNISNFLNYFLYKITST